MRNSNMHIQYRNYEPDKGFEEIRAKLFNLQSNRVQTAQEVKERIEREKIDPKTILFAFQNDNKPLGFTQAFEYLNIKEVHMGRGWTIPECPDVVKATLFEKLLVYMKSKIKDLTIIAGTKLDPLIINLAQKHGMKVYRKIYRFIINLDSLKNYSLQEDYYLLKEATLDMLNSINKCHNIAEKKPPEKPNEAYIEFIKTRIQNKSIFLVCDTRIKQIMAVCVSPLPSENDQQSTLKLESLYSIPGKEKLMPILIEHALKKVNSSGFPHNQIIINTFDSNKNEIDIFKAISEKSEITDIHYSFSKSNPM